jgi:hypothetical protein
MLYCIPYALTFLFKRSINVSGMKIKANLLTMLGLVKSSIQAHKQGMVLRKVCKGLLRYKITPCFYLKSIITIYYEEIIENC